MKEERLREYVRSVREGLQSDPYEGWGAIVEGLSDWPRHVEADTETEKSLRMIRGFGKKAGLSLKPATPETAIEDVIDLVDLILVMTVEPGFGGQSFMADQVGKISRIKDMIGDRPIELEVDGGIDVETTKAVTEAGANVLVAGSAVFKGDDYEATIGALRAAAG